MTHEPPREVSELLQRLGSGDPRVSEQLFGLVYDELRALAGRCFAAPGGRTLQPTALVHEAWLKLNGHLHGLNGRRHFFALAARAMRQVLANEARARRRIKRSDGRALALGDADGAAEQAGYDVVAMDDLLTRLKALDERQARVVELRFLGGLTIEETAEELCLSRHTVEDDWALARAWLRRELARG